MYVVCTPVNKNYICLSLPVSLPLPRPVAAIVHYEGSSLLRVSGVVERAAVHYEGSSFLNVSGVVERAAVHYEGSSFLRVSGVVQRAVERAVWTTALPPFLSPLSVPETSSCPEPGLDT